MSISEYQPRWMALEDAARELGVSLSTLYRARRNGPLRSGVHWHRLLGDRSRVVVNVTAARLALLDRWQ